MSTSKKRSRTWLITFGVPLLCLTAITGAAITASSAKADGAYVLWPWTGGCLVQEAGTNSVYNPYPANSEDCDGPTSQYYYWDDVGDGLLVNAQSGECLSVDGTDSGVYMATCSGNDAQNWTVNYESVSGVNFYEFKNGHTGYYLATSGSSFIQTPAKSTADRWIDG